MAPTRKNILILSVLYLTSRLLFLTRYPIFNDEAIYLRYAWVSTHVPHQLWYSLSDTGKQPLLYWLYGLSWQVVGDPLLAGRLVSVFIGLTTVWAGYLLGGWTAAILFITAPIFVFFDRLALVDSALAAIFAWILVLLVRLRKQNAMRTAILTGLLVGISLWIKSIGFLFGFVTVLELLYLWLRHKRENVFAVAVIVFFAAVNAIALPLFLRPEAAHIFARANEYTFTVMELVAQNFANVPGNAIHAILDYMSYISPFVVLAFIVSLRSTASQKKQVLVISWLVTMGVLSIFGKSIHARYVLFTTVPMIVLSSVVFSGRTLIFGITVALMSALSAVLIIDPPAFFHVFPFREMKAESYGYVDGWPSGYGVKEALAAIDEDRRGRQAMIAIRWDSGNPEDAAFVYAAGKKDITVKRLDARLPQETRAVLAASTVEPVYFLTRQGQYNGFERYLVPMGRFPKPGGKEYVELFRVRL